MPAENAVPTFFDPPEDYGESMFGPGRDAEVGKEVAGSEEGKKTEAKPEEKATPPGQQDADYFERIRAWDQEKQDRAAWAAAENKRQEAWSNHLRELFTPPPAPSEEIKAKLTLEPDVLLGELAKRDAWNARLARESMTLIDRVRQDYAQQLAVAQANATVAAVQVIGTTNRVASQLQSEGVENVEQLIEEADAALRSDPQNYLVHRADPASFDAAVRFVMANKGVRSSGRPSGPASRAQVASLPSLPYTPSAPASTAGTAAGFDPAALRAVEERLGFRLKPETLKKFGASHLMSR